MNIVFFGTSEFALTILRKLIDSRHKVLTVVTQPDRQKGRALKVMPAPTKVLAETKGIPVYQPNNASSKDSIDRLKKLNADLFVVVAFGQILKKEVLDLPKICSVNVHGSLLPNYRGAAPTNWTIMNGEKTSGVTIIRMNERMDEGDIILKKEVTIDQEDTNITLSEKLSDLGAEALIEAVGLLESGKATFTKQDGSNATYAPKLKKEDGLIDWNEPALKIHNNVRGLLPWPGAFTRYGKSTLKILKTEMLGTCTEAAKNGEFLGVLKGRGMAVKASDRDILVQFVQTEGKKAMDAEAFLRGHRIRAGYVFF
jgi:methionyl-tRNA formyltransferase